MPPPAPPQAEERFPELYSELRGLAARHFARQPADHTLQPTALINEAWIKLSAQPLTRDRAHFMALASRVMRQVLVDHARARRAQDPRPQARVTLSEAADDSGAGAPPIDVLDLEAALEELARLSERKARLIELRFFGGLGEAEAAAALGISRASAARQWRMARAWLSSRLLGGDA